MNRSTTTPPRPRLETTRATPGVAADIEWAYSSSIESEDNLFHWLDGDDAYRAFLRDQDYTWGSNRTKAHQGLMYLNMNVHGLDPVNGVLYCDAAAAYLPGEGCRTRQRVDLETTFHG